MTRTWCMKRVSGSATHQIDRYSSQAPAFSSHSLHLIDSWSPSHSLSYSGPTVVPFELDYLEQKSVTQPLCRGGDVSQEHAVPPRLRYERRPVQAGDKQLHHGELFLLPTAHTPSVDRSRYGEGGTQNQFHHLLLRQRDGEIGVLHRRLHEKCRVTLLRVAHPASLLTA